VETGWHLWSHQVEEVLEEEGDARQIQKLRNNVCETGKAIEN
jgi:hypothetical protein